MGAVVILVVIFIFMPIVISTYNMWSEQSKQRAINAELIKFAKSFAEWVFSGADKEYSQMVLTRYGKPTADCAYSKLDRNYSSECLVYLWYYCEKLPLAMTVMLKKDRIIKVDFEEWHVYKNAKRGAPQPEEDKLIGIAKRFAEWIFSGSDTEYSFVVLSRYGQPVADCDKVEIEPIKTGTYVSLFYRCEKRPIKMTVVLEGYRPQIVRFEEWKQ